MKLLGKSLTVAVLAWCCVLVLTAPLQASVTGPQASRALAFTPEVEAAMQAFLLEFNAQSALAAQFPDDPVGGHASTSVAQSFPARPTQAPPVAAHAPPTSLQERPGVVSANVGPKAPTHTIPEAYAQYHSLLVPSKPPSASRTLFS